MPDQKDVFDAINKLCLQTLVECETALAKQKEDNAAKAKQFKEEEEKKEEMVRLAAEWEEQEWQDILKKVQMEEQAILVDQRALEAKLEAVWWLQEINNMHKEPDNDDGDNVNDGEDNNNNDKGSDSALGENVVCPSSYILSTHCANHIVRSLPKSRPNVNLRKKPGKGFRRWLTVWQSTLNIE